MVGIRVFVIYTCDVERYEYTSLCRRSHDRKCIRSSDVTNSEAAPKYRLQTATKPGVWVADAPTRFVWNKDITYGAATCTIGESGTGFPCRAAFRCAGISSLVRSARKVCGTAEGNLQHVWMVDDRSASSAYSVKHSNDLLH